MKCIVEVISDTLSKPSPMPVSKECFETLRGGMGQARDEGLLPAGLGGEDMGVWLLMEINNLIQYSLTKCLPQPGLC